MNLDLTKIKVNKDKVAFCRFKKLKNKYLVTNDVGDYILLNHKQFRDFLEGNLKQGTAVYQELKEKWFIRDDFNINKIVNKYRLYNASLFRGPSLHIVVATLRCNFKCIYCQASRRSMDEKEFDMNLKTAKKVVDTIFKSPSRVITIEFQGGEPLVNWPAIKFIVKYARKKAKKKAKKLFISLVTNLSLMTEEKYRFLIKNRVSLCTSLDGPEEIHNRNRPWPNNNSYKITTSWIKKIKKREEEGEKKGRGQYHLSALTTISRFSLKHPKEIINEYLKWGFRGIHLRPLSFLGLSGGPAREKIGYSTEEFMEFWRKSMDYIIEVNRKGKFFYERGIAIMLRKIITDINPGFLDLRSPCGAAIGQLVYNHDGKVYTCDEGRMVKDDTFLLGDINKDDYKKIISSPKVETMITCSTLDNLSCDLCAYKPFCGVCPVVAYALYGNIFPQHLNTNQCRINKDMFKYIFERLEKGETRELFDKWVEYDRT